MTLEKADVVQHSEYFPIRVNREDLQNIGEVRLQVQTIAGRGLWLFSLRRLLTNTIKALYSHRWTILQCPAGFTWATSDDPVIKLNYQSPLRYDFGGGWGSAGTEIFLPLGPKHLLYARVGARPPNRGTVVSLEEAKIFQKFIVEHAHRMVFSAGQDPAVVGLRARAVDAGAFAKEAEQWSRWHEDQVDAERDLMK
jgi:hypothetical protein